jgi:hypothetical protein
MGTCYAGMGMGTCHAGTGMGTCHAGTGMDTCHAGTGMDTCHAGTGMGASGNATLFGRKPHTVHERVESAGVDGRARTACRRERRMGARECRCGWEGADSMRARTSNGYTNESRVRVRKGGHGQHVGANVKWVRGQEGAKRWVYV